MTWESAGTISVDAGCVMVGDPCYTQGRDATSAVETWQEFLERTWPESFGAAAEHGPHTAMSDVAQAIGGSGVGIVVSSGYGDGQYPVFVRRNDEGRVAELRVVFIGEDPSDEKDEELGRMLDGMLAAAAAPEARDATGLDSEPIGTDEDAEPEIKTGVGRGPSGRLRNFGSMGDEKLRRTLADVLRENDDAEAIAAIEAELEARG
jgi:hypothetical protein